MKYPEYEIALMVICTNTCRLINYFSKSIESEMPYKAQYLLEEVIKKLQEKI